MTDLKAEPDTDDIMERLETMIESAQELWARVGTAEARVAELEGALRSLIRNASILQQNSEGCAANHHGEGYGGWGTPSWLTDTAFVIEAARQALESAHVG